MNRTTAIRLIGACKVCRRVHTSEGTRITTSYRSAITGIERFTTREVWPPPVACCNRQVVRRPVQARVTSTPCDVRCTHARGHKCECQCGGKNHGAGHGATP